MNRVRKLSGLAILLVVMAAGLSGCFLRLTLGHVVITDDIGEKVDLVVGAVFSESTVAACYDPGFGEALQCNYVLDGEQLGSTFYLVTEFGVQGLMIDPLVVQLPEDAFDINATYDDGSGPQPAVVRVQPSFYAQADILIEAEPGHTFAILEFPPSVSAGITGSDPETGPQFDFTFGFKQYKPSDAPDEAVPLKAMFTGKVVSQGFTYYVPLLPCVTDFAQVPAFDLPVSGAAVDLKPAFHSLLQAGVAGCNHKAYYFDAPPPVTYDQTLYLPFVLR